MFAIAALRGSDIVGVAIVGRPSARLTDAAGELAPQPNLEVLRVAVVESDASVTGNKGACSMLYGACARAARAMGAENLFTYIHHDEPGVTLKAAGWALVRLSDGGEWDRPPFRPRQKAIDSEAKLVWFAPWSLAARGSTQPPPPPAEEEPSAPPPEPPTPARAATERREPREGASGAGPDMPVTLPRRESAPPKKLQVFGPDGEKVAL